MVKDNNNGTIKATFIRDNSKPPHFHHHHYNGTTCNTEIHMYIYPYIANSTFQKLSECS